MASIKEVEAYTRGLGDGIECVRTVLVNHRDEQPTVDTIIGWLDRYLIKVKEEEDEKTETGLS